uniref:Pectinesterase inhibitor domain-containing protein n=1 Tax=Leersia perrieri TaxID=77586 RepID=A0A0D9VB36_9ORYZ
MAMFLVMMMMLVADTTTATDMVEETCGRCRRSNPNVNYTLCVASLSSYPGSRAADLRGLALISAMPLRSALAAISSSATDLRDTASPGSPVRSCLDACLGLFRHAALELRSAVAAVESWRYGDARTAMSAAVDAPVTCEDEFKDQAMDPPPAIKDKSNPLFQQGVISLAIISLL